MSTSESSKSLSILERVLRERIQEHRELDSNHILTDAVEDQIMTITRLAWGGQFDEDRSSLRRELKRSIEFIADEFEGKPEVAWGNNEHSL